MHMLLPGAGPLADLVTAHATVHILPSNPWVIHDPRKTLRWLTYNVMVASRRNVALVRALEPDVVITDTIQLPVPAIAARIARVPNIWLVHGLPSSVHPFPPLLLGTPLTMHLVSRLSQLTPCVSQAVRNDLERWVPPECAPVLRLPVDIPAVQPATRPNGAYRLILVGLKSPGKGQHEALRALKVLRDRGIDAELDLVGSSIPGHESELVDLASSLRITPHVRFLPHRDDALALMAAADVALMCSRHDAFPRVTIEAMKLGRPVVAAADYGVLEQVQHNVTGLMYQPGDWNQLADRVEFIYRNPHAASRLARAGQEWALREFNLESLGDQLESMIDRVVTSGSR